MRPLRHHGWGLAALGVIVPIDAFAKDVAGLFIGAFVLSGAVVGLVVGMLSALMPAIGFLRGGLIALGVSAVPWLGWLLYWDFPFPSKSLAGNLPFLLLVLIGTLPVYLMVYGVIWLIVRER